eukprot:SAG11_NODE_6645_length_1274_cov_1.786383_1_plen_176_part_10
MASTFEDESAVLSKSTRNIRLEDTDEDSFSNPLAAGRAFSPDDEPISIETFEREANTFETEITRSKTPSRRGVSANLPNITIGEYMRQFMLSKTWTVIVTTATFLALFQVDICQMYFSKQVDRPLAMITLSVFLIFAIEMTLNFMLKIDYGALPFPQQFTFYMILDLIGTISLIPD